MLMGVLYPLDKMHAPMAVYFLGNEWNPTLTIGGGPVFPEGTPPSAGGIPIHPIWGPPGFNPPGPGMPPGIWGDPIIPVPPNTPDVPPPGSPPTVVGGTQPVNPIVPPPAVVIEYPGVGKVIVPLPLPLPPPTTPPAAKK
jgi:hypothetical protein